MASRVHISTPHSSAAVPPEIEREMLLSGEAQHSIQRRLFLGGDPLTDRIFRIPGCTTLNAQFSRFVVDLNRSPITHGENGVIKLKDFDCVPLYPPTFTLTEAEQQRRIALYYEPFHDQMRANLLSGQYTFFIDGHSMSARGPALSCDQGCARPAICIGNEGDAEGKGPHTSCPAELMHLMRATLLEYAPLAEVLAATGFTNRAVTFNDPFTGGHITRTYAAGPAAVHGVLLEVNRALYLNEDTAEEIPGRIAVLNGALCHLVDQLPRLQQMAGCGT